MKNAVIFGSSGYLGEAIWGRLKEDDWHLIAYDRSNNSYTDEIKFQSIHGVVFAQGLNISSGIVGSAQLTRQSLEANTLFILERLEHLVSENLLSRGASILIISSIWQKFSRQNKIPYVVSKSAIEGLVKALCGELGGGIRINALLPGVVDSPMAREALSDFQIERILRETPGNDFLSKQNVASVSSFLLSDDSVGINGQSLILDLGWSSNIWLTND
jgi:3-oxoacyl-[acyl-carrier protein] reductase